MAKQSVLNTPAHIQIKAWQLINRARAMAALYEERKDIASKYVHATSMGHEAIQIAVGMHLSPSDFAFPYYRDDAMLLAMGFTPFDLMLQLLARKTDYFSGGRTYYAHPSSRRPDRPQIPHQSSATGMQIIPATGAAQGLKYLETQGLSQFEPGHAPLVLCSLGDGAMTEGEVAEALQMAALHQYPIVYLVQDNEWDISAHASEIRAQDAAQYAQGFRGLRVKSIQGTSFTDCYEAVSEVFTAVRTDRGPYLLHVKVPLLNHHTSGVRKEWYRSSEDLSKHALRDPYPALKKSILYEKLSTAAELDTWMAEEQLLVKEQFEKALLEPFPQAEDLMDHIFAPTPVLEETGKRSPEGSPVVVMVDAALHAVDEILQQHPEALLYGQDVGGELGGVFREAALLAKKHGDRRVFNTPIMEAYIVGSTVGMSAAGCKPIVEIQFADYLFPGINQLFTEVSRSCYLSNGKWPVSAVIRVPIGAYGSGGPYHSSSVESVVLQLKGVKVVYPSNAADMKGLMKAAFDDPNPVVIFEHKGLYWSKVPGTQEAKTPEPDAAYRVPLGKARMALEADSERIALGEAVLVITYGMGVHWALQASKSFPDRVSILDLRTLNPLDEAAIDEEVRRHNRVLILTEETVKHSFAEALAGRISSKYFQWLDAPVQILGSLDTPAIPLSENLEKAMLPNAEKTIEVLKNLLDY